MYWYFIYNKSNSSSSLIRFFNNEPNIVAFIPKIEQWYNVKGVKDYVIRDMYPGYIFIKSMLSENEFIKRYQDFFKSIENTAELVKQGNSFGLQKSVQEKYEQLFNDGETIKHSIGYIVGNDTIVLDGPLIGLEEYIKKIDRHHRTALLDFKLNDFLLKVPLEIKSKS